MNFYDIEWLSVLDILDKDLKKISQSSNTNIDEKVVSNILDNEYRNEASLRSVKNMFDSILLEYSKNKEKSIPELNHSIIDVLTSLRIASKKGVNGYALFSDFKNISDMFIIKTIKDIKSYKEIVMEYFIGTYGLNKLRNLTPNFSYVFGIFECNLFGEKDIDLTSKINMKQFCNKDTNKVYYVLYEKIKGISLKEYIATINSEEQYKYLLSYILQILLSLEIAQREIGFVHYDLHSENIMLKKLDKVETISYKIDGKTYIVETDAIPTIIDYGMSRIEYENVCYGIPTSSLKYLGVDITKFRRGYDMYKLFFFVLHQLFEINKPHYRKFSDLSLFFEKIDIYGIVKNRDTKDLETLNNTFRLAAGSFYFNSYSLDFFKKNYNIPKEKVFFTYEGTYNYDDTPVQFVEWIVHNCYSQVKDVVKVSEKVSYDDMTQSIIGNLKYLDIYKKNYKKGDCSFIKNGYKSYTINNYIIKQIKNITKEYNVSIDEVKDLEVKTQKYEDIYKQNDKKILKELYERLFSIDSVINYDFLQVVNNLLYNDEKYIDKIKSISVYIEYIEKYIKSYKDYQKFEEYSFSTTRKLIVDKKYTDKYHSIKNIYRVLNSKKTSYLFSKLQKYMDYINYIDNVKYISDINKKGFKTADDIKNYNFLKDTIENLQKTFDDIIYYFPQLKSICYMFDDKISNIIILYSFSSFYLYPRSLKQVYQVCQSNYTDTLVSLIKKYLRKEISMKNVSNMLTTFLNREYNDIQIFEELRKYRKPEQNDKIGRANSRVKHLQFLFNDSEFKSFFREKQKYMDFGGSDGSICQAIGKYLKLDKKDMISADVEEWVGGKSGGNSEVTYVTINKKGKLPFDDQTFSLISCFMVLHHIEDVESRISELSRITKSGGYLVLREHDCIDSISRMIIDMEHTLYESLTVDTTNTDFFKNYFAFYKTQIEWTNTIEKYGFKFLNLSYNNDMKIYNPSRTYYAVYKKM